MKTGVVRRARSARRTRERDRELDAKLARLLGLDLGFELGVRGVSLDALLCQGALEHDRALPIEAGPGRLTQVESDQERIDGRDHVLAEPGLPAARAAQLPRPRGRRLGSDSSATSTATDADAVLGLGEVGHAALLQQQLLTFDARQVMCPLLRSTLARPGGDELPTLPLSGPRGSRLTHTTIGPLERLEYRLARDLDRERDQDDAERAAASAKPCACNALVDHGEGLTTRRDGHDVAEPDCHSQLSPTSPEHTGGDADDTARLSGAD